MNILQYYLLNRHHGKEYLAESYLESLYKYYEKCSEVFEYKIQISKSDFIKFFSIKYDVLRFKLDLQQFSKVVEDYLKLIIHDALDGEDVDVYWFIKHIWYLSYCLTDEDFVPDYKDCIGFIQNKMIREFGIQENIKQKVNRKICTFLLK